MIEILFDEYVRKIATEKAHAVKIDGKIVWLPKSQCKDLDTHKHSVMVEDWLVKAKGLEGYVLE